MGSNEDMAMEAVLGFTHLEVWTPGGLSDDWCSDLDMHSEIAKVDADCMVNEI